MITFCYNPTSWNGGPIPGGMADCLVRPILPHLETPYQLTDYPELGSVNVFYAHRARYGKPAPKPGGSPSVFVSHGIADKNWRNGPRLRGQFDWVFVSGPAWTGRMHLTQFDPARTIEVGYAKLDPIFNGEVVGRPKDGRIRVVWAPTHGGGGERARAATESPQTPASMATTYWNRDDILSLLPPSEFDVVEAVHPRHRVDGRSTLSEYVGADVVIADGGSTIYEAWALDIPVVFADWLTAAGNINRGRRAGGTIEADIYRNRIGWHVTQREDFAATIVKAAEFGITVAEQDYVEPILPRRYRGQSGRMHAEALDDIAASREVRHVGRPDTVRYRSLRNGQEIDVVRGSAQHRRCARFRADWEEVS